MDTPIWPSAKLLSITPSNSTEFSPAIRQLYVGTGGNVSVTDVSGATVVFKGVASGSYITPIFITKVNSTLTTAADIIGFY